MLTLSTLAIALILALGFIIPDLVYEFIAKQRLGLFDVPCKFEKQAHWPELKCYSMVVPESYEQPLGSVVTFPVVHASALNPSADPAPLLHLGGGGPGYALGLDDGTNIDTYLSIYGEMSIYRGRDLYLIDPRGAGLSQPTLHCEACAQSNIASLDNILSFDESQRLILNCLHECKNALLSKGIDLRQYYTDNVVRDINALRSALGISVWNLYGISYAGKYAIEIASHYPSTVQAMILDSTVFPHIQTTSLLFNSTRDTFNAAVDICENSSQCLAKYPHLSEQFEQALKKLSMTPLYITVNFQGKEHEVVLDTYRFLYILLNGFYEDTMFEVFPNIVHAVLVDNNNMLDQLLGDVLANELNAQENFSLASYLSHYCYDEHVYIDYEDLVTEVKHGVANSYLKQLLEHDLRLLNVQCSLWINESVDLKPQLMAYNIDVPTLFLHGGLDPVFPAKMLHEQMKYFSNHNLIIFQNIAHGTVGVDMCAAKFASSFLDNHSSADIDSECF